MLLEVNTVWLFHTDTGHVPGEYRLLAVYPEIHCVVFFSISETNNREVIRPFAIPEKEVAKFINANIIKQIEDPLSHHRLFDESRLSTSALELLNERWNLIKPLVADKDLLLSISTKVQQPKIASQAQGNDTRSHVIYRLLNIYWRHGQTRIALTPKFYLCGAAGNERQDIKKSLGRKIVSRTGAFSTRESYIVTDQDKLNIIHAVKAYHLKPDGISISQTYKKYIREYFAVELVDSTSKQKVPTIPSIQQFRNWAKKLIDKHLFIQLTKHEKDYLLNYRENSSSIVSDFDVPGACFEIDATVVDVHIVSKLNRNRVLGRPTLYFVVDRASGMTVGIHLSLFNECWDAARLAIFNTFTSKVNYCRVNGVDIVEQDWPCAHLPNRLIADNAEMLGLKAEEHVTPMVPLEWAPVSRPDFKPFAEGRFNTLNKETVHELQGATKNKDKIVKAAPDPRSRAIYTLEELTTIILRDVIDKNKATHKPLGLRSKLLVETDTPPSPLNYWNIHVKHYFSALKKASEQEVEARLLRPVSVSVTKNGIFFEEIYYFHEKLRTNNLMAIAKSDGRIELEARVNDENLDYIFVKFPSEATYTRCNIARRSSEMRGLNIIDNYYVQDWLDDQNVKNPVPISSLETQAIKNAIKRQAQNEARSAPKNRTKKERVDNKRENRLAEMAIMLNENGATIETRDSGSFASPSKKRRYSHNVFSLPVRKDK